MGHITVYKEKDKESSSAVWRHIRRQASVFLLGIANCEFVSRIPFI